MRRFVAVFAVLTAALAGTSLAQDAPLFTPYFPAEEFRARQEAVMDAIGDDAVALLQGAPSPAGYLRFRQHNDFYYLSGVETPHAYLLVDGASRRSALYLPHRNERRESSEGKVLSAEDAGEVVRLTGVDDVHGVEMLSEHLARRTWGPSAPAVYTPFAPAEGVAASRDLATRAITDLATDPWDGRPSREGHFIGLIQERLPRVEVRDLSPILDRLRMIKSEREVAMIRRASQLSTLALLETMRSVRPGTMEYEVDALANFVFLRHGAQHTAYYSLVGSGTNAWYPHYHKGGRRMADGDFLLVDVGADFQYYTTDITRMMPVNGRFNDWQRELYGFYVQCYRAILDNIRPGEVADIARDAAAEMERILEATEFSKPEYERAARQFVGGYVARARGGARSLGHWVGMAVHDVGPREGTLEPGMVFTIEPALRVPEEQIYIRLEDMIVIRDDGAEVLSADLPMDIEGIEALMSEQGLLEAYPLQIEPLDPDALEGGAHHR